MNQTLCFVVNHVEIYLEQVLVENDGVPILFVGKNNERRYLILCVDTDVLRYFAVRISRKDLCNLLQSAVFEVLIADVKQYVRKIKNN